jgi:hypothetical protein
MPPKPIAKIIKRLRYDDGLNAYMGTCEISGHRIEVCIWSDRNSKDYKELRDAAEEVLRSYDSLQEGLVKFAKRELIDAGRLKRRSKLTIDDLTPFAFAIRKDEFNDDKICYDFGFHVPALLRDDEFVEVVRYLGEPGGGAEVRSLV